MNETFVQDAENDINGHQRGKDQDGFIRADSFVGCGRSLEAGLHTGRHMQIELGLLDGIDCLSKSRSRGNVEGDRHDRKLSLMRHGKRSFDRREMADG